MRRSKTSGFVLILLISAMLLTGCNSQGPQTDSANSAAGISSAANSAASASSTDSSQTESSAMPSDAQQAPEPSSSREPPKNATWVLDINDTQQITDEMGIVWNYTLTFHASKPGGTNVTGEYAGEAFLEIEPDFGTVQAAAASEGTQLLSMIFNYYAQCESLTFVVEKFSMEEYNAQMKQYNKDSPLQPLEPGVAMDFFAVTGAVFNATQEPVTMTIQDEDGPKTGSGGGGGTTVNVPTEISVDGATAFVFFYNTPHPLARAFKGTITGDVLPS